MTHIASLKRVGSGVTNNMLEQVTQIIRKTGIKCLTTSHYYIERDALFQGCMEYTKLELDIGKKYKEKLELIWTVRCIDVKTLLERIYNPQGNINVTLLHFKLGLDYGRGFLKLLISKRLENTVNAVYYLWVAQVPETYHNFRVIFDHEQMKVLFSEYNISLTVDLKAASIACGVMLGRCPCIWCKWDVNDHFNQNSTNKIRNSDHHMEMWNQLQLKFKGNSNHPKSVMVSKICQC